MKTHLQQPVKQQNKNVGINNQKQTQKTNININGSANVNIKQESTQKSTTTQKRTLKFNPSISSYTILLSGSIFLIGALSNNMAVIIFSVVLFAIIYTLQCIDVKTVEESSQVHTENKTSEDNKENSIEDIKSQYANDELSDSEFENKLKML